MAKKPSITTVSSGYQSTTTINDNFQNLRNGFDNTLSLDGSSPNAMQADLDMNSNDILNVNSISVDELIVDNLNLSTVVQQTAANAAAAAASYDSFDDRYLGAKSTAPTLDNDGNALLTGALYWNTTSSQMFVRSGASWINYESTSVTSAATATTQAGIATTQAGIATTQATTATNQATAATIAKTGAEAARDAALNSRGIFPSTAAAIGFGVATATSIVGGSAGTNGTFDLAFTGGTGSGAAGRFVVSGGALTSIIITAPGSYTVAPTFSFAASSGLTGASATCVLGRNVDIGEYFSIVNTAQTGYDFYKVDAGPTATYIFTQSNALRFHQRAKAVLPRTGPWPGYFNGYLLNFTSSFASDGQQIWTAAGSGNVWWDIDLTAAEIAASGNLFASFQCRTGTPSGATLQQYNSSGSLIAGTTQSLYAELDFYVARRISLDATCTRIRVKIDSGAGGLVVTTAGIGIGEPATSLANGDLSGADSLSFDAVNAAPDVWSTPTIEAIIGTGSVLTGRTLTIPSGVSVTLQVPLSGWVASDSYMVVAQISSPMRDITATPNTGGVGGNGDTSRWSQVVGGWIKISASAAAAAGANPARLGINFDNRTQTGMTPADPVSITNLRLYKNISSVPQSVSVPGSVTRLLQDIGLTVVHVDTTGNDGNTGTRGSPVATVSRAVALGASVINLRAGQIHRTTGLQYSSLSSAALNSYRESTDTAPYAYLYGSSNVPAASWTQTVADANVYYYAASTNPRGLWEVSSGGTITRLGVPNTSEQNRIDMAGSETIVRSNAGSWWFGTGSEGQGIYVHPVGSSITGKSYEVPACNTVLTANGVGIFEMNSVSVNFGRDKAASITRCNFNHSNCRFGYTGFGEGVSIESSTEVAHNPVFEGAGNDGWATVANVKSLLIEPYSFNNGGDGIAPHNGNNDVTVLGGRLTGNYKNGFVTVGTGKFVLDGVDARGNSVGISVPDIYFLPVTGVVSQCRVRSCLGSLRLTAASTGELVADVTDHRGTMVINCSATVLGVIADGENATGSGIQIEGGTIALEDISLRRFTYGLNIGGGSVTVGRAQLLRNTIGIYQTAGTLTLDANDPVNLYGNGTATSGVGSGEVAKTVSIAAV